MAISRDDIQDIARATAQEVVNKLHRYHVVYQDPETVQQGLTDSIGEELTASFWYRERAKHARRLGDESTALLYEHISGQEDDHHREFNRRLAQIS
jgi:rubrerythrin